MDDPTDELSSSSIMAREEADLDRERDLDLECDLENVLDSIALACGDIDRLRVFVLISFNFFCL